MDYALIDRGARPWALGGGTWLTASEIALLLGEQVGHEGLLTLGRAMRRPEAALLLRIQARSAARRVPDTLAPGDPCWWDDATRNQHAVERARAVEHAELLARHASAAAERLTCEDISALVGQAREVVALLVEVDVSALPPELRGRATEAGTACETLATLASDPWYWEAPVAD